MKTDRSPGRFAAPGFRLFAVGFVLGVAFSSVLAWKVARAEEAPPAAAVTGAPAAGQPGETAPAPAQPEVPPPPRPITP
ncbi:MAG TPA: hypothetical protein VL588_00500, partial [Bdellovibrionota bacterium]|nr:hypothetical protein [Bdellovibrionota bacterium]